MTAQAPMATSFLAKDLIFLSLTACSSEEMAPSTKATSMGPMSLTGRKILAYLKSRYLVHVCQCWFKSSVIEIVESPQQIKVNQPIISFL